MRQISGGHEFRPHGGLLLSRDWRKSMQNSLFLPGLLRAPPREITDFGAERERALTAVSLIKEAAAVRESRRLRHHVYSEAFVFASVYCIVFLKGTGKKTGGPALIS